MVKENGLKSISKRERSKENVQKSTVKRERIKELRLKRTGKLVRYKTIGKRAWLNSTVERVRSK